MAGITWGSSLPPEYADNIAAVATFGNVADRTGGSLPNQSALLGAKAIDLCNPGDPICHAGPGNAWSGHTEGYVPGYTDQAAAFVAARLLAAMPQTVYGPPPGYGPASPTYDPQTSTLTRRPRFTVRSRDMGRRCPATLPFRPVRSRRRGRCRRLISGGCRASPEVGSLRPRIAVRTGGVRTGGDDKVVHCRFRVAWITWAKAV